jgi:hypothetical protein
MNLPAYSLGHLLAALAAGLLLGAIIMRLRDRQLVADVHAREQVCAYIDWHAAALVDTVEHVLHRDLTAIDLDVRSNMFSDPSAAVPDADPAIPAVVAGQPAIRRRLGEGWRDALDWIANRSDQFTERGWFTREPVPGPMLAEPSPTPAALSTWNDPTPAISSVWGRIEPVDAHIEPHLLPCEDTDQAVSYEPPAGHTFTAERAARRLDVPHLLAPTPTQPADPDEAEDPDGGIEESAGAHRVDVRPRFYRGRRRAGQKAAAQ